MYRILPRVKEKSENFKNEIHREMNQLFGNCDYDVFITKNMYKYKNVQGTIMKKAYDGINWYS